MRVARLFDVLAVATLAVSLLIAVSACDGDDGGPEPSPTDASSSTPFSLGKSVSIRGRDLELPAGVAYINQTADCQLEANASSDECLNDLKMLVRGETYIIFDPRVPRVIARLIQSADEGDFRPLLNAIAGTEDAASPDQSPGS